MRKLRWCSHLASDDKTRWYSFLISRRDLSGSWTDPVLDAAWVLDVGLLLRLLIGVRPTSISSIGDVATRLRALLGVAVGSSMLRDSVSALRKLQRF